jgi:hypothetical protein
LNKYYNLSLRVILKSEFDKAVSQLNADKYCKGFSSWEHFVSLCFAQLAKQESLRVIETGLHAFSPFLIPLASEPVARSTLSYANNHRSFEIFKTIFEYLLGKTQEITPTHKFRLKNEIYSVDATTIDLCLSLFEWAEFRKTKG